MLGKVTQPHPLLLGAVMTEPSIPPALQALGLAAQALFLSNPNPRVGCVITSDAGQVLGRGFTQQAGGPHAEVVALQEARALGHSVEGAIAYVTLEPCSHHGRTGPCCDALIAVDTGITPPDKGFFILHGKYEGWAHLSADTAAGTFFLIN